MRAWFLIPLLVGCPTTPVDDDDSAPAEDPCEDVDVDWSWIGNPPFVDEADPVDAAGLPFHDPAHDVSLWTAVTLPDVQGIPEGQDRAYRATFELVSVPPDLTLEPQSDDGIAVWVNGELLGRWGGAWQQEGCVNEDANCTDTVIVPPQSAVDLLVAGTNTVAARVSNPLVDSFFDLGVQCVP